MTWFCFALCQAFHWKSLSKKEEYLPSSYFIMKVKNIKIAKYTTQMDGDYTEVEILFGVKDLNREKVNWWDPNGIGMPVWDGAFDITDPDT